MIFGYTFTATIVSGIISMIVAYNLKDNSFSLVEVFILIVLLIVFYFVRKFFLVKFIFNKLSEKIYRYFIAKENINSVMVIENFGTNVIAQVFLNEVPVELSNKTLAQMDIKNKYNLLILTITLSDNKASEVTAKTIFQKGTTVTVMWKKKDIKKILCP